MVAGDAGLAKVLIACRPPKANEINPASDFRRRMHAVSHSIGHFSDGPDLAQLESVSQLLNRSRIETLAGRSVAMCVHPYAAWRSQSTRRRVFVIAAYLVSSYAVVLGVMLFVATVTSP
jgi:hypothetical protein